jgi:hypothetical protein
MASYNRARWIGAAIESALAQTFEDFEVLIVDDRSTDGTLEIAREYARRDGRIRVIPNDVNLGQFGNRNRAAGLARGRFLKYHDSDDLMYPHCLDVMLAGLAAAPAAGFALSIGWFWPGGPCPMLLTPRMCYQREFLGMGMFNAGPSGALFRAEVFAQLGGFPELGVGSDHIFWLRACARTSVVLVPADLFWYRVHPEQEFHSPSAARDYTLLAGEAWRALSSADCPLDGAELEQARRNLVWGIAKQTWRDLRVGRFGLASARLRQAGLTWKDWLRYCRRARRSLQAGTPLDERGEFIIPEWCRQPLAAQTRDPDPAHDELEAIR